MAKFNSKRIQIFILSESSLKCQTLIRRYFSVWEDLTYGYSRWNLCHHTAQVRGKTCDQRMSTHFFSKANRNNRFLIKKMYYNESFNNSKEIFHLTNRNAWKILKNISWLFQSTCLSLFPRAICLFFFNVKIW